jgi:hypothetical protein
MGDIMIHDVARRLALYVKSQASVRVEDLDSGCSSGFGHRWGRMLGSMECMAGGNLKAQHRTDGGSTLQISNK